MKKKKKKIIQFKIGLIYFLINLTHKERDVFRDRSTLFTLLMQSILNLQIFLRGLIMREGCFSSLDVWSCQDSPQQQAWQQVWLNLNTREADNKTGYLNHCPLGVDIRTCFCGSYWRLKENNSGDREK